MAEVFQTVGFALDAARELLAAAQRIAEARSVLRKIADRAALIEASLESIQDILCLMRDKFEPLMPRDKYERLQNTLSKCVDSCRKELDESFGLFDSEGRSITTPTIMRRLKVATRSQRIQEDRATLDSVISHLHMSITTVNTALNLTQIQRRESVSSPSENDFSLQSALDQVNERTQLHNEQVQRWRIDFESDAISIDEVSRVDSAVVIEDADNKDSLSSNRQLELERKAKDNEWSIVHQALYDEDLDTFGLLLQSKPMLKDAVDAKGQTPLHHCASAGGVSDAVQKAATLLRYGVDVNSEDVSEPKRTPLYLAVRVTPTPQQIQMVELLVDAGATVDIKQVPKRWSGYTCLKQIKSR